MNVDKVYLELCKRLISEKFGFENGHEPVRQRELEYISKQIEEKSGIRLSLSTLKRLWRKDYDQTPHPATLDALVSLIGYDSWQDFKMKQTLPEKAGSVVAPSTRKFGRWMVWPAAGAVLIIFWLIAFRAREPGRTPIVINGPVVFEGNKTVANGVPSTIIFKYDVSNIQADSFFFQQSWNENDRVRIDPKGQYYSNIYYYPGFHKAKLIANDSIVRRFRAHIMTDGWLPLVRYKYDDPVPIYVRRNAIGKGTMHVTPEYLDEVNVDRGRDYLLTYFNVREFRETESDNFTIEARAKVDSSGTVACPGVELVVMCEVHIFVIPLISRGCERELGIKIGEVVQNGQNNDLSSFGRDIYQWQELSVRIQNKNAVISIAGKEAYNISFKQDFGKVVGVALNFNGTGAVDYVRMKNGRDEIVMNEDFDPGM